MHKPGHVGRDDRRTRASFLRTAAAGGAVVAGGTVIAARGGQGSSIAASTRDRDSEILKAFLLLEYVQEAFYEQALRRGRLTGDLKDFASTVSKQETDHIAFLRRRLKPKPPERPVFDFGDALSSPQRFRDRAIELEEATIAAYIGQSANLTRQATKSIAMLVSVEARQVAWLRDLAGVSPAPRAADPGREPADVLADLRNRGYIR